MKAIFHIFKLLSDVIFTKPRELFAYRRIRLILKEDVVRYIVSFNTKAKSTNVHLGVTTEIT